MVAYKKRYLVMEVFLDPNRELGVDDPIELTQYNVTDAIKHSLLTNFPESGLTSSLGSLHDTFEVKYVNKITKICIIRASREMHPKVWSAITLITSIAYCPVVFNLLKLTGCIRACKEAALKCEGSKFEQYKLVAGSRLTPGISQEMQNCLEKIKLLNS